MNDAGTIAAEAVTPTEVPRAGLIARRPALLASALFVGGIFLHRAAPSYPILWIVLISLLLTAAMKWRHLQSLASLLIAVALLVSGILIAQLEAFYYSRDDVAHFATDRPRLAQIELFIDHEPRVLSDPYSPRPMPPKQVVTARVTSVKTWDGWTRATGEVLVQIAQPHPRLALGQHVRILGMLERPAPANNPGQFDWANYYRSQRILTSVHISNAANIQIVAQDPPGFADRVRQTSRRLLAAGFPSERSLDHALLRALLLGDGDPELRDVQEQFRRTGTSHHLSISGMHVAVLGGFVYLLCRLVRLRPRVSVFVMLVFVVMYGIAALPSPPVVRSILACVFFGFGMMSRRAIDPLHLLAVSVWAMLVYSPLDIYSPGFQLSFGTVLGLILLTPVFAAGLAWFRKDDLAVRMPQNVGVLRRAGAWAEHSMNTAFAAAAVAWLVSMPLIAFHFEQVNFWAIPASLILGPVVFVALIGGFIKVVLTAMLPSFAGTWASLAAAPMGWMRGTLDWLARLPKSDYPFPGFPLWAVVVVLAFYSLFLLPCPVKVLRRCMRVTPAAVVLAALWLPYRSIEHAVVAPTDLTLTLLAVGAGQAAVLETPAGRTAMIDAGSSSLSDALRKCIGPYLRTRNCTQVDTILLTHSDYDHVGAAAGVAQVYDAREVLIGPEFRAHAADNSAADQMLRSLEQIDVPPRTIARGDHFPLGRDVEVEVLWPPKDGVARQPPLSSNDSAVVARIIYGGRSILVTGDIQDAAERELLKHPDELRADVLIAPHHGSSESTTEAFVAAVSPSVVVSSNDRTLTGKQKRLDRIVANRAKLFRTNECGAITVRIGGDGSLQVEPYLKRPVRIDAAASTAGKPAPPAPGS